MNQGKKKTLPAKSLAKGLEILEFIVTSTRSIRLKDVSDEFSMDMASTHRVLVTLLELGYISRLNIGKAYGPGDKLKQLAKEFASVDKMVGILRPVVRELTEATGHVSHLGVLQGAQAILVEVAVSDNVKISVRQAIGDPEDLCCSAIGKAILAHLPDHQKNALIRSLTFEPKTPYSLKTPAALRKDLKNVVKTGLAYDNREGEIGVSCIAAPIRNEARDVISAIGVSMAVGQFIGTPQEQEEIKSNVLKAAKAAELAISQQK